nr:BAHD63 [Lavandula angustifolia]
MAIIIAKHILKPSSPTPPALKTHRLSYIDQLQPPVYVPLFFFYKNDESTELHEIVHRLKNSLSETLNIFYPLAGTIKHNSYVDCNDRGAEFVEALVHARLSQFMQDPKMEELMELLPVDCLSHNDDDVVLSVKMSYFDCGGVVVGVCLSHNIGDGTSLVAFMNAWAANCKGEGSRIIHPSFDLALHFPPRDGLPRASGWNLAISNEKIMTKRLLFNQKKIEELKKQIATSSEEVKDPSKVEAVTVFIWKSLIEGQKACLFTATHTVNLRPRVAPEIPNHTFGNCIGLACAVVSSDEDDDNVHASRLRAAIRAVDNDYINKTLKADKNLVMQDKIGDIRQAENYIFTSWTRFPMYDVDFGWGKPDWVCTTNPQYMNVIILMSTPSQDGIEAWVSVRHDVFQLLQDNYCKLST